MAVGIILLFIATSIIPATAQDTEKPLPTSRGNWLYVGGNGPGNYSTIQSAINASNPGDTVFVYNGTYYENIVIYKNGISLIGENKNTTVIDGDKNGYVVEITGNNVKVTGFIIQNLNPGVDAFAGISIYRSIFNTITGNNICFNAAIGLKLYEASNNVITGNTFFGNHYGICLSCSSNVDIIDNVISNEGTGVYLDSYVNNCTISGNIISNNSYRGMNIYHSCTNLIRRNTFKNNSGEGGGLSISVDSNDNRIEENNFIDNKINALDRHTHGNSWLANYWDDWIGLKFHGPICQRFPKFINYGGFYYSGKLYTLLYFDWHPVSEPYNISVN